MGGGEGVKGVQAGALCPRPPQVLQEPREVWGKGPETPPCGVGPTPGPGGLLTQGFQGEVTLPAQAGRRDWPAPAARALATGRKELQPRPLGFLCKQPGRHRT